MANPPLGELRHLGQLYTCVCVSADGFRPRDGPEGVPGRPVGRPALAGLPRGPQMHAFLGVAYQESRGGVERVLKDEIRATKLLRPLAQEVYVSTRIAVMCTVEAGNDRSCPGNAAGPRLHGNEERSQVVLQAHKKSN